MSRLLTDVQLILFDIDGTLMLPKGAGRASTKLAMMEIFKTAGGIDDHHFGGKTDWQTLLDLMGAEGFSSHDIQRLMPEYEAVVARHLEAIIPDYPIETCPGALEAVHEVRRREGLIPGIVTGNVSSTAPIKLRAAGFDPSWFSVGAYGSEAADRNDLPPLALRRAEKLTGRRIAPEQVVVIGDTPADIACARALGAVAVAVATGYTPREELTAAQPDYFLDDLTQFFGQVML